MVKRHRQTCTIALFHIAWFIVAVSEVATLAAVSDLHILLLPGRCSSFNSQLAIACDLPLKRPSFALYVLATTRARTAAAVQQQHGGLG